MLKMSIDEIKSLISLREEYWEHNFETNCYAFALGLDVPENDITNKAYQLGVIGSMIFDISIGQLKHMTYDERILLDLKALKIGCKESSPEEKSYFDSAGNHCRFYWLISLFSNGKDFHFVRKNYNDEWYHKIGYFGYPINYDSDKKIIADITKCSIKDYEYVKTYRLHYCKRSHSLFKR